MPVDLAVIGKVRIAFEVNSVQLSLTTVAGSPRASNRIASSRATRAPESEISAITHENLAIVGRTINLSGQVFRSRIVQNGDGEQRLQLAVLILDRHQTLGLAGILAAKLGLPSKDGCIIGTVITAQVGHGNPSLLLLQDTDNLGSGCIDFARIA
jgi:hypothetical protein